MEEGETVGEGEGGDETEEVAPAAAAAAAAAVAVAKAAVLSCFSQAGLGAVDAPTAQCLVRMSRKADGVRGVHVCLLHRLGVA